MNRLWMVAYDIENNRVRRRVYALLESYGEWVQYSVFECWLTRRQQTTLQQQVAEELDAGDSVRWYPLCVWCQRTVQWQGMGEESGDAPFYLL